MTLTPYLQPDEEAALLKNLLCDPDDEISRRVLELHYQALDKSENRSCE
jgi:hypothetical protein